MVKLRLKRFGRRHVPTYRLNAIDSRSPRNGRVIEELGSFDPHAKTPEEGMQLNADRIRYWLSVGAQPSRTVASLLRKSGIDAKPGTKYEPAATAQS
jgi:small subunit ribosomal protein S16